MRPAEVKINAALLNKIEQVESAKVQCLHNLVDSQGIACPGRLVVFRWLCSLNIQYTSYAGTWVDVSCL